MSYAPFLDKDVSHGKCIFHPLELVDRGSETQVQVGEKINYLYILMVVLYVCIGISNVNWSMLNGYLCSSPTF